MVVDGFDIFCTSISPDETDAPLHVYANAVLTTTVASRLLQTVTRGDAKIFDILRGVVQFSFRNVARCNARSMPLTYSSCQMHSVSLLPNDLITRAAHNGTRQ